MTGDRDMYQCATDRIGVLYLKQGSSGFEQVDPDEVRSRYGDRRRPWCPISSRSAATPRMGFPAPRGSAPKTATALLQRYGTLEAAIAGADGEKPRLAAALRDHAEQLRAFKEIATLRAAPVQRPPDARRPTWSGGAAAARALGMNRLAERLQGARSLSDLLSATA